jgi:hypothetical protein
MAWRSCSLLFATCDRALFAAFDRLLEALHEGRVPPHERISRPVADLIVARLHQRAIQV